jgi:hypothetical protein
MTKTCTSVGIPENKQGCDDQDIKRHDRRIHVYIIQHLFHNKGLALSLVKL